MWMLIISAILFPFIVLFMPKKIPRIDLYATTGMATYFQLLTDVYLHMKLNWYGYFHQHPRNEWATAWLVPLYLSINPIYLNFYPYHRRKIVKVAYIAGWSLFSVAYEWAADKAGFFYHNQWKLYHSAISYPILFVLLRLQLTLMEKLKHKDQLS